MAGYNRTRYVEQLLERTETSPPSFTVHLHTEYWVLNNGSKFLYHNQIASLLDDIRAHRIPVDFLELFDSARVPFYDGCMIVELLDYRPQRSSEPALKNPERTRVVLHPSPETLWIDICSLNQRNGGKWTDNDALEIEAKLLRATSQPLCLDPDPNLTRIVNNVLRASTPSMPLSLKRKASALEPEEDGPEKAKRERLLGFMAPREKRLHASNYRLLDAIEINRQKKETEKVVGATQHGNQYMAANSQSVQPVPQPTPTQAPAPAPATSQSPTDQGDKSVQKETTQTYNAAFHPNGTHTPVPAQPHQFGAQPSTTAQLPAQAMQPQVYASLQAAKEAANNRTPTPAQQVQIQQQQQIQNYQHYVQQYQQQMQQPHQLSPTPLQPVLPRPPSQPQHAQAQAQAQPSVQLQTSPQPPAQQLNPQPQRFTHTPKPSQTQPTTMPTQTQTQYTGTTPSFQGTVSNSHFLQPAPSGVRPIQKAQQGPITPTQHPQLTIPANPQAQIYFNQQLQQHQAQQSGAQPTNQQQQQILQRMSQVAAASGGRTTPSHVQQSPRAQAQPLQPSRAVTATPSPVKGSPIVNQQSLATANQPRVSPMQAKAQIPIQQAGHSHPVPVVGQQPQQTQQPQGQQPANAGGIQIAPQRLQFQPQYNPSPLRPVIHGNTQIVPSPASGVNAASGPPAMVHASPIVGGGRPLTPVVGADVKSQQPTQTVQGQQQQPIRRPTPQAAMAQMQGHPPIQQQTPQIQQQQLPQAQVSTQGQQLPLQTQTGPTTSQMQQTPVQTGQLPSAQQQAQQQMAAYTQLYGYAPYWRVPQQQQQQQGQSQQNTTQMQLAHQQAQQQQILSALVQQISQQAQVSGQRFTSAQIHALASQKLAQHQALAQHAHAQAQAQGQLQGQTQVGAQQQAQGGQQLQAPQQSQQPTPAQAQAMMMGKMQMQVPPPQMHSVGQGSAGIPGQQQQQGQATLTPAQMQMFYQQAAQAQTVQQGAQKGKLAGKGR